VERYGTDPDPAMVVDVLNARLNRMQALAELQRTDEAIRCFDEIVSICDGLDSGGAQGLEARIRQDQVGALGLKSVILLRQGKSDEALAASDELVERFGSDPDVGSRRLVADVFRLKARSLWALGRGDEVPSVCEEIDRRFGDDPDPVLRQEVAQALLDKGKALGQCDRWDEAAAVMDTVVARCGEDADSVLRKLSARARSNKIAALG
jgi:tetratricopeptide (TPR) repeat protein